MSAGPSCGELLARLDALSLDSIDERAALYTELAEAVGQQDASQQQAYLQKAYELRLKSVAAAVIQQQASDDQLDAAKQQPQQHAAPAAARQQPQQQHHHQDGGQGLASGQSTSKRSSSGGSSNVSAPTSGDDWDVSDDWEPDVSRLRAASSFERERTQAPAVLQPFASHQPTSATNGSIAASGGISGGGGGRSALSEPSCSVRQPGSSGGGSGSTSTTPSRPRGRGTSKLSLAAEPDDDAAALAAAVDAPHVVEIHGLTRAVSTTHLEAFLLDYVWAGLAPNIKWVDDAHALAVFPCAEAAAALLGARQSQFSVRPFSRASSSAQHIAPEELAPPRAARPKTTTAVARRLISNALGNREVRDRAAETELAALRRANKEERQQRQLGLEAAWADE